MTALRGSSWRVTTGLVAAALMTSQAVACTARSEAESSAPEAESSAPEAESSAPQPASCLPQGDDARAWETGPTADAVPLTSGNADPQVRAAVYPRPDYEGNPWSQWGQGVVLADGRFISAIGDHLGPDGNSFFYEYDPAHDRLTRISDVLSLTDHRSGEWGYGKVHAQLVVGPCGEVYAATYWGTRRELAYSGNYDGDLLFRLDPAERTIKNLGTILDEHGVPSMAGWAEGGLLYAEAANPEMFEPQRGAFVVLDMATGSQVFATGDEESHRGFRAIAVDAEGRPMFSREDGTLARWEPEAEEVVETDIMLPGAFLRAATAPAPDGTVYLVTQEPNVLLALGPDDELRELGEVEEYTASLAMDPDGSRLWYIPDAHGGAADAGTPIIEVDTETGEQRTLVELDPLARSELGLSLGGTYNVAVDDSGSTLYIGMNAASPEADSLFGEVVLVIVELT